MKFKTIDVNNDLLNAKINLYLFYFFFYFILGRS